MRAVALVTVLAVVALAPALGLAGQGHGLALFVYALFVAGLGLALLIDRLARALPRKTFFWPSRSPARDNEQPIAQLERIERALSAASWNESHLLESMRPLVREIVVARLRRHHRVDLDRSPDRAHAIVGDGYAWSLVRPDREMPLGAGADGWSRNDLNALLDELEAL
jgi:hypothetical protein